MSGGGVDWTQRLQNAEAALLRAEETCAAREKKYENAQKKLEEHVRANPVDTDSVLYKTLFDAKETAKTSLENAEKKVDKVVDGVNEAQTQAGRAQAAHVC